MASELPTAICIGVVVWMPLVSSKNARIGAMTIPPPTPRRPARKPEIMPVTINGTTIGNIASIISLEPIYYASSLHMPIAHAHDTCPLRLTHHTPILRAINSVNDFPKKVIEQNAVIMMVW